THYASRALNEPVDTAENLGRQLKSLLKEMGGSAKACAISVSSAESLIRIIEQPETPVEILRDALRLNGIALLNQDCKDFVLDCDRIPTNENSAEPDVAGRKRYVVGGLPRSRVAFVGAAVEHAGTNV